MPLRRCSRRSRYARACLKPPVRPSPPGAAGPKFGPLPPARRGSQSCPWAGRAGARSPGARARPAPRGTARCGVPGPGAAGRNRPPQTVPGPVGCGPACACCGPARSPGLACFLRAFAHGGPPLGPPGRAKGCASLALAPPAPVALGGAAALFAPRPGGPKGGWQNLRSNSLWYTLVLWCNLKETACLVPRRARGTRYSFPEISREDRRSDFNHHFIFPFSRYKTTVLF